MPQAIGNSKICSACRLELPISAYHGNKATKDKLQSQCKECALEATKESQGMKRENLRLLKEQMAKGGLAYSIARGELRKKYIKSEEALALTFGKDSAKAAREAAEWLNAYEKRNQAA